MTLYSSPSSPKYFSSWCFHFRDAQRFKKLYIHSTFTVSMKSAYISIILIQSCFLSLQILVINVRSYVSIHWNMDSLWLISFLWDTRYPSLPCHYLLLLFHFQIVIFFSMMEPFFLMTSLIFKWKFSSKDQFVLGQTKLFLIF